MFAYYVIKMCPILDPLHIFNLGIRNYLESLSLPSVIT